MKQCRIGKFKRVGGQRCGWDCFCHEVCMNSITWQQWEQRWKLHRAINDKQSTLKENCEWDYCTLMFLYIGNLLRTWRPFSSSRNVSSIIYDHSSRCSHTSILWYHLHSVTAYPTSWRFSSDTFLFHFSPTCLTSGEADSLFHRSPQCLLLHQASGKNSSTEFKKIQSWGGI